MNKHAFQALKRMFINVLCLTQPNFDLKKPSTL